MRTRAENLPALFVQAKHAAQKLHEQATEIHELTQCLESLTRDNLAGMPAGGPERGG